MKVLLINGSPHENGCTYTALREVAKILETFYHESDANRFLTVLERCLWVYV